MDLRFHRLLSRMSQRRLGIESGMSQSKVHEVESGYRIPSDDEKARIAAAINVSVDDIDWSKKALVDGKKYGASRVE